MLEIIADCAPGASLAFSSGFPTSLAFISSVNSLRAAGAQIIVDDLSFPGESPRALTRINTFSSASIAFTP